MNDRLKIVAFQPIVHYYRLRVTTYVVVPCVIEREAAALPVCPKINARLPFAKIEL